MCIQREDHEKAQGKDGHLQVKGERFQQKPTLLTPQSFIQQMFFEALTRTMLSFQVKYMTMIMSPSAMSTF